MMSLKKTVSKILLAESEAIKSLVGRVEEQILKAAELCLNCNGRVIVTGLGKSGLVGRKISATLSSTGTSSFFVHAAEALHGDLGTITEDDCAILISKSGATGEVLALIPQMKRKGVKIIAITTDNTSPLAKEADITISISQASDPEPFGMVPTSSTTATMAVGDALAIALMVKRGFTKHDFAQFHPAGNLGHLLKRVSEVMHTKEAIPIVSPDTKLSEAIVEMSRKRLGHVIIVDGGKCSGIFSDGDLRRTIEKNPHSDILKLKMSKIATKKPTTVPPSMIVEEAIRLLETKKITALPVVDHGKLIGIVHLHDLLESKVV